MSSLASILLNTDDDLYLVQDALLEIFGHYVDIPEVSTLCLSLLNNKYTRAEREYVVFTPIELQIILREPGCLIDFSGEVACMVFHQAQSDEALAELSATAMDKYFEALKLGHTSLFSRAQECLCYDDKDASDYWFVVKEDKAIVVEKEALVPFLEGTQNFTSSYLRFKNERGEWEILTDRDSETHLQEFPLFHRMQQAFAARSARETIFSSLFGNKTDLCTLAQDSFGRPYSYAISITEPSNPLFRALEDIAIKALQGEKADSQSSTPRFKPAYKQDLETLFAKKGLEVGAAYWVVGYILTKLSSSHFWGTESDSPRPLRLLASAMLSEAQEALSIDSRKYNKFQDILLGRGSAFTCTAILSGMIKDTIKKPPLHDTVVPVYTALVPGVWE